jgi:plasmid maintenance system killer protein
MPPVHRRISTCLAIACTSSKHQLKGDLRGFWSLTVRANWRIIFRFQDGDTWDVELTDYH